MTKNVDPLAREVDGDGNDVRTKDIQRIVGCYEEGYDPRHIRLGQRIGVLLVRLGGWLARVGGLRRLPRMN